MRFIYDRCLAAIILAVLVLVGCSSHAPSKAVYVETAKNTDLEIPKDYFKLQNVPNVVDIFSLTPSQQQNFLHYYNDPANADVKGHERLYDYLSQYTASFDFRGDTFMAAQSLTNQAGNCLSLAILTTALAELVGVDIEYQKVNSAPIYQRYSSVMTLSSHVRTVLHEPNFVKDPDFIYFRTPQLIVDYFPQQGDVVGSSVSRQNFVSMFYQNLASEALINHEYDRAFSLLNAALSQTQTNSVTLNTLAVLYKHADNFEQAEKIYRFAIDHELQSINMIWNYVNLLEEAGRFEDATHWRALIENVDDDNPYSWIDLADQNYQQGHHRKAARYYQKASLIAPYLHESFFGLAKAQYQLGELGHAEASLKTAMQISYLSEDKKLYQAKINTLH